MPFCPVAFPPLRRKSSLKAQIDKAVRQKWHTSMQSRAKNQACRYWHALYHQFSFINLHLFINVRNQSEYTALVTATHRFMITALGTVRDIHCLSWSAVKRMPIVHSLCPTGTVWSWSINVSSSTYVYQLECYCLIVQIHLHFTIYQETNIVHTTHKCIRLFYVFRPWRSIFRKNRPIYWLSAQFGYSCIIHRPGTSRFWGTDWRHWQCEYKGTPTHQAVMVKGCHIGQVNRKYWQNSV